MSLQDDRTHREVQHPDLVAHAGSCAHLLDTLSTACPALAADVLNQMRAVHQVALAYPKVRSLMEEGTMEILVRHLQVGPLCFRTKDFCGRGNMLYSRSGFDRHTPNHE